jgi:transcriptional regulator with XRE-family HTH domain
MTVEVNKKSLQYMGKRLREIREQKNLLQEEVADRAKISITYYAAIERGEKNPSFTILTNIDNALKLKCFDIHSLKIEA